MSASGRGSHHHRHHHTSSSFASIERTFARVQDGQIQRVRVPPRASTTSAHHASGGSPSSLGSAIRPQIAQISPTKVIRTPALPGASSAARGRAGTWRKIPKYAEP